MFRWSKIFKKQRQVNHLFNFNEFKLKLILMNEWVTNYFNFNVFVLCKALDFIYVEYSQLFIRDAQREIVPLWKIGVGKVSKKGLEWKYEKLSYPRKNLKEETKGTNLSLLNSKIVRVNPPLMWDSLGISQLNT
jgi:hypothetical protein